MASNAWCRLISGYTTFKVGSKLMSGKDAMKSLNATVRDLSLGVIVTKEALDECQIELFRPPMRRTLLSKEEPSWGPSSFVHQEK
ncbi:hypothetical protein Nepgr_022822 [Nepenthes gracilis]|uniref:Uncharacterized protein n=1 Tax=Nepenthes gracilis TaxID=150966 RepID=A0AAD3T1E3_NEPGR|nr:hypothetical protein Nepgr_022822 [Nepenthes gracilis]